MKYRDTDGYNNNQNFLCGFQRERENWSWLNCSVHYKWQQDGEVAKFEVRLLTRFQHCVVDDSCLELTRTSLELEPKKNCTLSNLLNKHWKVFPTETIVL